MASLSSQALMAPIFELLFDVFDGLLLQSSKVCLMNELPVIGYCGIRKGFWDRPGGGGGQTLQVARRKCTV